MTRPSFTFELDEHMRLRLLDPEKARQFKEWLKSQERLYIALGPVPPPPPNQAWYCGVKPITNPRGCPNEECPFEILTRIDPATDPVRDRPVPGPS